MCSRDVLESQRLTPQVHRSVGWSQDEFWISFWVGPQVPPDELGPRVAEIAEANFTGYLGFNGAASGQPVPDAARVAHEVRTVMRIYCVSGLSSLFAKIAVALTSPRVKQIELCADHGLRCVPSLCDIKCCDVPVVHNSSCLPLGKQSPAFWGFQLLDEPFGHPNAFDFRAIGAWSRSLATARPDVLRYINLEGAADVHHFPTVADYAVYIQSFVKEVEPQVLSMDFYPYFAEVLDAPCPPTDGDHCRDTKAMYGTTLAVLRTAAETSATKPIPFWNFFNSGCS